MFSDKVHRCIGGKGNDSVYSKPYSIWKEQGLTLCVLLLVSSESSDSLQQQIIIGIHPCRLHGGDSINNSQPNPSIQ